MWWSDTFLLLSWKMQWPIELHRSVWMDTGQDFHSCCYQFMSWHYLTRVQWLDVLFQVLTHDSQNPRGRYWQVWELRTGETSTHGDMQVPSSRLVRASPVAVTAVMKNLAECDVFVQPRSQAPTLRSEEAWERGYHLCTSFVKWRCMCTSPVFHLSLVNKSFLFTASVEPDFFSVP